MEMRDVVCRSGKIWAAVAEGGSWVIGRWPVWVDVMWESSGKWMLMGEWVGRMLCSS